ncbi:hypothetical protein IWQ62_006419, partial [Dispira parvispora]
MVVTVCPEINGSTPTPGSLSHITRYPDYPDLSPPALMACHSVTLKLLVSTIIWSVLPEETPRVV